MSSPLFASVAETSELLGISDDLVYDLISRGELPASTFGRRKLVPRRAIDLVVERALAGFDPDRLLSTLAPAAGSSSYPPDVEQGSDVKLEGPPPAAGSTTDGFPLRSVAPPGAPAAG